MSAQTSTKFLCLVVALAALWSTSGLAAQVYHLFPDSTQLKTYEWVEPSPLDASTAQRLFTSYDTGSYGEFDALAEPLTRSIINPFEFEAYAEAWIASAEDRRRRALVVATVALELASRQRPVRYAGAERRGVERTMLHLSFVLAEVGCAFLLD